MAKEEKSGNETNKKIVSLDIGSSKIGVFIGEILENGKVRILRFGNPVISRFLSPSRLPLRHVRRNRMLMYFNAK